MKSIFYIVLVLASCATCYSQENEDSTLFETLKAKDSIIFDIGFNKCKIENFEQLVSDDFEFYHDIAGIQSSKEEFIEIMKNGLCNPTNKSRSRRELVEGSLEVYPLKENGKLYGALQTGIHKFYVTTNGNEVKGSIAKFSHLWILEDNSWRIKRVISYNHKMPDQ